MEVKYGADKEIPSTQTISQVFRQCRKALALAQITMAARLGVSRPVLNDWEQGRIKIPTDALLKVTQMAMEKGYIPPEVELFRAGVAGLTLHDALGLYGRGIPESALEVRETKSPYQTGSRAPILEFSKLSILEKIEDQAVLDWVPLRSEEKNRTKFATRLLDDSMEPEFRLGDLIGVGVCRKAKKGDYVLVVVEDQAILREWNGLEKGLVILIPRNHRHPPTVLSASNLRILGKVLWKLRDYQ